MLMLHTNVIALLDTYQIFEYYLFQLVMKFEKIEITKRFVIIIKLKYNYQELIIS